MEEYLLIFNISTFLLNHITRERIQILIANENEDKVHREEAFMINVVQGRVKRRKNVTGGEEKGKIGK